MQSVLTVKEIGLKFRLVWSLVVLVNSRPLMRNRIEAVAGLFPYQDLSTSLMSENAHY
jgi:hypothetical protein